MILKVLGGLAAAVLALILAFFVAASFQPADFTISRSIFVSAPAQDCFIQVNNFHNWENWSPWAKMDPGMQTAYDGPVSGEGAMYSWMGNGKVGAGQMRITKSQAFQSIDLQLDFFKPMKTTNLAEFTFVPEGQGTRVTWTMTGKNNLIGKAIHMVLNLDKLVGPDFEQGLAQLKGLAEAGKK